MGMTGKVDHWTHMTSHAGSNLVLRICLTAPGAGREAGHEAIAYHLITPETRTASHCFFGQSMNFGREHPELGDEPGRRHARIHRRGQADDRGVRALRALIEAEGTAA